MGGQTSTQEVGQGRRPHRQDGGRQAALQAGRRPPPAGIFVPGRPLWHLAAHVRDVPLPPSHVPCACLDFHGMGLCQSHVYMCRQGLCTWPPSLAFGRPCQGGAPASQPCPLCMPWLPWHGTLSMSCLCAGRDFALGRLDFHGVGACQCHVYV